MAPLATAPSTYDVYKGFSPTNGRQLRGEEWALARTLATGETIVAEDIDIERFDGTRGHILNSTAPIVDDPGRLVGGIAVVLDVTAAARGGTRARAPGRVARLRAPPARHPARRRLRRSSPSRAARITSSSSSTRRSASITGSRDARRQDALSEALPELRRARVSREPRPRVRDRRAVRLAGACPMRVVRTAGPPPEQRYVNIMYQPLVEADGTTDRRVRPRRRRHRRRRCAQQRIRAQFNAIPVPTLRLATDPS